MFASALRATPPWPKRLYLSSSWAAEVALKADGRRQTSRRAIRAKVVGSPPESLKPEDYLTNSFGMVVTIAITADKAEENHGRPFNALRNS